MTGTIGGCFGEVRSVYEDSLTWLHVQSPVCTLAPLYGFEMGTGEMEAGGAPETHWPASLVHLDGAKPVRKKASVSEKVHSA